MGVDELGALGASDPDDARGQTKHEPELAREGLTPASPPGPIVVATVGFGARLGRGEYHRLEP